MRPIKLDEEGGGGIIAYACGECYKITDLEWMAERCRKPIIYTCGKPVRPYHTSCQVCIDKKYAETERVLFEKAEKISWRDYAGPVYDGSRYHADVEDYMDILACDYDREDVPIYVWACTTRGLHIDAEGLINNFLPEYHEDAGDQTERVDELQSMLDVWCKSQRIESWDQETTRVVLLAGIEDEVWPI